MARTKKEAINWIKNAVGKGFDTDGLYGYQCKDLANAYSNYLGYPFKAGNAITIKQPQKGWKKVSVPQPGDVFVMDYWAGGVNYGHTGLVESVEKGNFVSVDQNWYGANLYKGSKAARVRHPIAGASFYRPSYKATPSPKPQPPKAKWVTVKSTAYVRRQPSTKAPLGGSRILLRGTKFRSVGVVRGEKVNGNDKWHKSSKGNFVWSGNIK